MTGNFDSYIVFDNHSMNSHIRCCCESLTFSAFAVITLYSFSNLASASFMGVAFAMLARNKIDRQPLLDLEMHTQGVPAIEGAL